MNIKNLNKGTVKQTCRTLLFLLCAAAPFVLADVVLRYILNPVEIDGFSAVPVLFSGFWIALMLLVCWGVLSKRTGRRLYVVLILLFGVWAFANYIYFCLFSQFLWLQNVLLAGEATDYLGVVFQYINWKVVLTALLYIALAAAACMLWFEPVWEERRTWKTTAVQILLMVLPVTGLLCTEGYMRASAKNENMNVWNVWEKPNLVYKIFKDSNRSMATAGLYQYTFRSLYNMAFYKEQFSEEDVAWTQEYFEQRRSAANEMTGLLKGKNVIYVLMESIDDWMITEKYTPTIKYMMEHGINFENHYMPCVGAGFTFNAEFAANTGYYCPSSAPSATIFSNNTYPYSAANLFKNAGYRAKSFHFNAPTFYNRKVMHMKYGYEDYVCFQDYMPYDECALDTNAVLNDDIYGQMIDSPKFFDFFITYSAHLPYNSTEDPKVRDALQKYPELYDTSAHPEYANAMLLAHDTDEFFRILLERLEADGLLDNTVIIGFSDHFAYGIQDKELMQALTESGGSSINERCPFFIYTPGIEPVSVTKVTSTIDILPTVANIMGLGGTAYMMGNDAFDPQYPGYVYFQNGSWFDGTLYYVSGDYEKYGNETREYIAQMNEMIYKKSRIDDYVVSSDYFKQPE